MLKYINNVQAIHLFITLAQGKMFLSYFQQLIIIRIFEFKIIFLVLLSGKSLRFLCKNTKALHSSIDLIKQFRAFFPCFAFNRFFPLVNRPITAFFLG